MQMQPLLQRAFALVAGIAVLTFTGLASADPPSRVARLGYMTGAISLSPAGENDWVLAPINRPLTTGDRLWADAGARAEIQVGGAMIRMNAATAVSILNLDDRIAQLQLTQGTLSVRVLRLAPGQVFEVDTPNLAFTLRQPGAYRIEVEPDGSATTIIVRKGQGEVYGEDAAYVIDSRQPYRFTGTGLREYQYVDAPRLDEFDGWSSDRDRSYDSSGSARYVSPDVIGYQDLDANGTWRVDATYGNVWFPNRVAPGWGPYSDGHWAWIDPWGWTWVDDAPWGFAVSHYGRWTNLGGTWGWVPGPVRTRAYYAPALVAFVGGSNFQLAISGGNVGGIAWFPLGPREVYQPSYTVSRGYFENINRSNTVINNTVINNYYNNTNVTNVVYANRQVPGAVVAVPTTAFVQSQPVSRAAVKVPREMVTNTPVAVVAPVAPTEKSVRGAAAQGEKPPARVFERPVVARTALPAAPVGFAAQQQQLAAKPGKPLDDAARKEMKPPAAAPTPVVKVVAPAQVAQPTVRPPPAPPSAKREEAGGKTDGRMTPAAPAISGAPNVPTKAGPPSQAMPAVPVAQPSDQRGKADQPGKREQRGQPVAPPPPPPQRAAPVPTAPPQVAPPAPTAQPPDQRGMREERGKVDQRGQPVAPPPPPPSQRAAPVPTAPPQVAPPAPTAQPPDQRGTGEQRGKGDQRGQPVAPPPPPPQRAAPVPTAPPQVAPPAPTAQPPDQRGMGEQRGKGDQRGQPVAPPPPPPQRAAEPKAVPPQVAPAAPPQPPPQRSAPPAMAAPPPPQATPPTPAARQAEPRPPGAAPRQPPPQPQPAPQAQPRGQEPKPAAGKPDDKKKDSDEQKREEESRKQKG
jgi:hypothetical protein